MASCACGAELTGRQQRCDACRREKKRVSKREYRERNREAIAERDRVYRESNRDKLAAYQSIYRKLKGPENDRNYYARNREKVLARNRAYREARKDQVAAKNRAYRERQRKHCERCNELLRHAVDDGLCGFCREELAGYTALHAVA